MGTRGTAGFRKGGADKLQYTHFDSYPDGVGAQVVEFCRETGAEEMKEIFDRIILVSSDVKPTPEQVAECEWWTDLSVSNQSNEDWYCLLRESQGDLNAYKQGLRYMEDSNDFIKDSLFCEYGYIVNLDDNVLEFWRGFQQRPQEGNRYGTTERDGYYPCRLMATYPLDDIPEGAVEQMLKLKKC